MATMTASSASELKLIAGGSLAGSTVVEKNLDRLTVVVSLIFAFSTMSLSIRVT